MRKTLKVVISFFVCLTLLASISAFAASDEYPDISYVSVITAMSTNALDVLESMGLTIEFGSDAPFVSFDADSDHVFGGFVTIAATPGALVEISCVDDIELLVDVLKELSALGFVAATFDDLYY
jgi:hypothetical protein